MRALRWLWSRQGACGLPEIACTRSYSTDLPDNLLPVVAIIGRPNVGKSALFNRLVRRREALVHNTPGGHVTRDYQEGTARLADLRFKVVDTSGLEPFLPGDAIQARATALTARLLGRADVALFLIDGSTGALPADQQLAGWLRKHVVGVSRNRDALTATERGKSCSVVLAANKCERRGGGASEAVVAANLAESLRLGLGEPVTLSAMTGEGMTDLYAALQPLIDPLVEARREAVRHLEETPSSSGSTGKDAGGGSSSSSSGDFSSSSDKRAASRAKSVARHAVLTGSGKGGTLVQQHAANGYQESSTSSSSSSTSDGPLRIAIMGLPNVGKSTLTNRLLQQERCLTGPEPGLTRDAIKERFVWEGREIELVDTAGWIRRTKLAHYDESGGAVAGQTVAEARSMMQFVHVVALLVDAERAVQLREGLMHREVTLASDVVAEGRLLLIVANKLDALAPAQREEALRLIRGVVQDRLPDVSGVPVIGISALEGQGAEELLPAAAVMYDRWNQRVPTARLNRWLEQKAAEYRVGGGQEMNRISYISQVKARPPTFVAWVSGSTPLSVPSQRFVAGQIRRQFGFGGVPIRLSLRYKRPRQRKRQGGSQNSGGRR